MRVNIRITPAMMRPSMIANVKATKKAITDCPFKKLFVIRSSVPFAWLSEESSCDAAKTPRVVSIAIIIPLIAQ